MQCNGNNKYYACGIYHYTSCFKHAVYKITFPSGMVKYYCPTCKGKFKREMDARSFNELKIEKLPEDQLYKEPEKSEAQLAEEQDYENSICRKCEHCFKDVKQVPGCGTSYEYHNGIHGLSEDHKSCKWFELSKYFKKKEENERQAKLRTEMFGNEGVRPKYKLNDTVYYVDNWYGTYMIEQTEIRDIIIVEKPNGKEYLYKISNKHGQYEETFLFSSHADALEEKAKRVVRDFKEEAAKIIKQAQALGMNVDNTILPALEMPTISEDKEE